MQSNISISSFRWEDTDDVVEFLNEVDDLKNTEKEISKEFFTRSHKLPRSNPLVDSFLAKRSDDKIIGFMHLIFEKKISRLVVITKIFSPTILRNLITSKESKEKDEIFIKFMDIVQDFAISNKINVIHTQIDKKESSYINYLKKDWTLVKEYWILKCGRRKGISLLKASKGFSHWLSNAPGFFLPYLHTNYVRPDEPPNPRFIFENAIGVVAPEEAKIAENTAIKNITRIQNASFRNHWGFCPNTLEDIRGRLKITNPNLEGIFLIKDQNSNKKHNIVGYNWTILTNKNGHSGGWISMTGVSPKYRGFGLGRAIVIVGMVHLLHNKRANYVELEVDSSNLPAVNLYKSLGFTKQSESIWFEKTNL